jgi:DNA polymerase-1
MFKIPGTKTYRFASSKNAFGTGMNLQNIPSGGEEAGGLELPNIRTLFIPDPGHEYFDIDLSAADLRIVVWESDCQEMKAMLRAGLDPYTEIAKEFYHDPGITKKDPRRQTFKSFAHGTNYLGTAKGLAERLGLSVKEAESTQKWYFGKFPEIRKWQDGIKNQVLTRRMVKNVFGYRLYIFERIEGTKMNEVVAWIPQSTVGCLINRIYMKIYQNLKEVQVQLQVHDSLAGQYPIDKAEWCRRRILEEAQIELPYPDPMIIPVGIKVSQKSWGDCR